MRSNRCSRLAMALVMLTSLLYSGCQTARSVSDENESVDVLPRRLVGTWNYSHVAPAPIKQDGFDQKEFQTFMDNQMENARIYLAKDGSGSMLGGGKSGEIRASVKSDSPLATVIKVQPGEMELASEPWELTYDKRQRRLVMPANLEIDGVDQKTLPVYFKRE